MPESPDRNLRLFQWFVPLYSAQLWVAVWFLYFLSYFSVAEVPSSAVEVDLGVAEVLGIPPPRFALKRCKCSAPRPGGGW